MLRINNIKSKISNNYHLFILILFIFTILIAHIVPMWKTPFMVSGDVFEYMAMTQGVLNNNGLEHLNEITGTTSGNYFPIYSAFPLLFILVAAITSITGIAVYYVLVGLNIIFIILLVSLFYYFCIQSLGDKLSALIATMVIWSGFFIFISTSYINYLIFFVLIIFSLRIMKREIQYKDFLLIMLLLTASLFSHHETLFSYIFTFGIFFCIVMIYYLIMKNIKSPKMWIFAALSLILPLCLFFVINAPNITEIMTVGSRVSELDITLSSSDRFISDSGVWNTAKPLINNLFKSIGLIWIIFIPVAFYYLFKSNLKPYIQIFWITLITIFFLGSIQSLFNLALFQNRFTGRFVQFSVLLGIFGVLMLLRNKFNNKKIKTIVILLILIPTFTNIYSIATQPLNLSWNYINVISDMQQYIPKGEKLMSDPITLFMTQGITGIQPAYNFSRPTRHNRLSILHYESNINVFQNSSELALNYTKNNNIKYIAVDSLYTPSWGGDSIEKFENNPVFTKLYSAEYDSINTVSLYRVNY